MTSTLLGSSCGEDRQQTLIMRLAQADQEAFAELILQHQHPLVNYLTHLCHCHTRAEDLAQESFIRIFKAIQKHPHREWQIRPYLYRIAVNLFCSQERRKKHFQKLTHLIRGQSHAPQPQERLLQQETQAVVSQAIAKLPLRFRVPLILREIEGWRVMDIASCLNLQEGTVKSRIFRGKQRLKTLLKGYWEGSKS